MSTSIISPHGGVNKLAKISLDTVTNTSGSYTHTTAVTDITADHKVLSIECSNNEAFKAPITISTDTDSITLSCDNVVGTSTVIVYVQMAGDNLVANSLEYGAISTRVGNLSDLTTSDKSSVVNSINLVNENIAFYPTERTIVSSSSSEYTIASNGYYRMTANGTSNSGALLKVNGYIIAATNVGTNMHLDQVFYFKTGTVVQCSGSDCSIMKLT